MIAKIIPNAKSFAAIDYNDRKVEKGQAKFCGAFNFNYLSTLSGNPTQKDYEKYLDSWSSKSKKVQKPQFHCVISEESDQFSEEQMMNVAHRYMREMGYGEQPYLLFFHTDTDNHHIHIVSTRVNSEGKVIDNDFENVKSLNIINSINEDLNANIKFDNNGKNEVEELLNSAHNYYYENANQFILILELLGAKNIEINGEKLNFKFESNSYFDIDISPYILSKSEQLSDKKIAKQKAIITKYNSVLSKQEFLSYMKNNMHLEFCFFGKENSPYGYAVIDKVNKAVIKGSSLVPLKTLLANFPSNAEESKHINDFIKELIDVEKNTMSSKELNSVLRDLGYRLWKGEIFKRYATTPLCKLEDSTIALLKYNDQVIRAQQFHPSNESQCNALSRFFHIQSSSLQVEQPEVQSDTTQASTEIDSILSAPRSRARLAEMGIYVVKEDDTYFMLNLKNHTIQEKEMPQIQEAQEEQSNTMITSISPFVSADNPYEETYTFDEEKRADALDSKDILPDTSYSSDGTSWLELACSILLGGETIRVGTGSGASNNNLRRRRNDDDYTTPYGQRKKLKRR